ncbi:MAG: alkaline phosphatase D family protein [Myxococcales bacterium]|nr:alkaline phosphatase D family protein [Myxococcales bacterium]
MPESFQRLYGPNAYATGPLVAGPMLGEGTATEARIWVQARSESLLCLRVHRHGQNAAEQELQQIPSADDWLCCIFEVTGLDPAASYEYSLSSEHGETARFPLRRWVSDDEGRVRIAFGSCYKEWARDDLRIFDAVAAQSPDVFLLLGDTCYTDEDDRASEAAMMQAHLRNRNNDRLRALIAQVPCLGIWDDHDYGPNDSDGRYGEKERSLRCFQRMWAQKHYGEAGVPGLFSRVRCGPVELFLLDSRYHRRTGQHVLGADQLNWLIAGLRDSTAPIKLILSGSQLLPEVAALPHWDWECFRRDGASELAALQRAIADEGISGVVALSGDPHLGQLFYAQGLLRSDGQLGPPLWELTSSPIANKPWHTPVWPADSHGEHAFDRYLLTEVVAPNFGRVDVDLSRAGAELVVSLCREDGAPFFMQAIDLSSLQVGPLVPHICAAVRDATRAYVFMGDAYVRCDPRSGAIADGYPKKIVDGWHGLFRGWLSPHKGLDAAFVSSRGKAYFFCGNGYVRYDLEKDRPEPGYPKYIQPHWRGLWPAHLIAALPMVDAGDPQAEKILFIHGRDCLRYDLKHDRADAGYPRPLAEEFSGLFADGIDSAVTWSDGAIYFLRGDQVLRYDAGSREPAAGYPRPLPAGASRRWLGFLE